MDVKPSNLPRRKPPVPVQARVTPLLGRKPTKPTKAVRGKGVCVHVQEYEVWCGPCAKVALESASKAHARAVTESTKPFVQEAARKLLNEATRMFSLTVEARTDLERKYANAVAEGNMELAAKLSALVAKLTSDAQEHNREARLHRQRDAARRFTASTAKPVHSTPPKDSAGEWTTESAYLVLTNHARERSDLRDVTDAQIREAFTDFDTLTPKGSGNWVVLGKNGITIPGYFTLENGWYKFVVYTVYSVHTSKAVIEAESEPETEAFTELDEAGE